MTSDYPKGPTDDVIGGARAVGPDGEVLDDDADDASDPLALEPLDEPVAPPPEAIAELCAACVRFVTSKYGVPLDFAPDTLSLVDQYIVEARDQIATRPETLEIVQAAAGAYLGEVIRQTFGGAWFAEGEHDGWRLDMARVYLTFNPLGMMREALLLEPQDGWHAHLETDPAEKAELEQRLAALPVVEDTEYYAPTTRFDIVTIAHEALRAKLVEAGHGDVRFGEDDYKK
jgi:Family of unknown function (DUF6278)